MGVNSEILSEMHTVLRTVSGKLNPADIKNAVAETLKNPGFEKGMHAIWDLSDANIRDINTDELLEVVEYIQKNGEQRGKNYKIAIVASGDLAFGLSRMFEGYGNELPLSIHVHKTLNAAYEWINSSDS